MTEATNRSGDEGFAAYFAKRLVGDKRFRPAVVDEAAPLVDKSDIVLSLSDIALTIACIVDREHEADKVFSLSQKELIDIGRACLKYTGTINGAKMPVTICVYELGHGPPSDADRARMKALRRIPGFAKVGVTCFYLDLDAKTAWSGSPFEGLLRGRRWIDRVLREPRKRDAEIFVADPALPARDRRPIATAAVVLFLVLVFVVEQLGKVGDKGSGPLGVDAPSLFALGGMNADAVLNKGEYYRLLSAALLHVDAFHLALNALALGLAGWVLESLLGRAWFLGLFFLGALGGSLMGLAVNPPNIVSVGASGAVMGLLAAALVAAMRFPPGPTRMQIQGQLLQFLIPSLVPLATTRHEGRIDFAAHFGGAILGTVAGYALMKIWPKAEERPRFRGVAVGLAVVTVLGFGGSLYAAKANYPGYAAEAAFSAADLLVDDSKIPKAVAEAARDVETWGKGYPRDPRVHFFRALRLVDDRDESGAEAELRAALGEREILDRAFPNKKFETGIRAFLCELLARQGRRDEARREAAPICVGARTSAPDGFLDLGLCD
jgi:rhomboid protease GluP